MGNYKIIYAKCPYCKLAQPWNSNLVGDYCSQETTEKCIVCGNKIVMTAVQITKFTARKPKREDA